MLGLDVLISVANVIYLLSYSVRDILWLRIFTVIGALLLVPYYYLQEETLWAAIAWNLVFVAINIFWIVKLMRTRRPVEFTDEERRLYEMALRNVPERDALGLLRRAAWKVVPTGTTLLEQGRTPESLMLISEGAVSVETDGKLVDTLGQGRFLAATAFLTRKAGYQARVTVTTTEQTRIVTWSMDALEAQLDDDLDLKVAMEASLGLELSRLLQTSRAQLIHLQSV